MELVAREPIAGVEISNGGDRLGLEPLSPGEIGVRAHGTGKQLANEGAQREVALGSRYASSPMNVVGKGDGHVAHGDTISQKHGNTAG